MNVTRINWSSGQGRRPGCIVGAHGSSVGELEHRRVKVSVGPLEHDPGAALIRDTSVCSARESGHRGIGRLGKSRDQGSPGPGELAQLHCA